MNFNFKSLRNIVAGTVLTAASAGAFAAASPFTIDPTAYTPLLATDGVFTADQLTGNSTVRLTNTPGTFNYTGNGYIQYSGASFNGASVSVGASSLNLDYGLYATFTQTFACTSLLSVGTSCAVTGISLSLFLDRGNNDSFVQASLASDPTVTNTAGDVLLGTVTSIVAGSAGLDPLGNAFQTVNTNFALTTAGSGFFIGPTPFYALAFSQFGNSSGGATCLPDCGAATTVSIVSESGSTIFNDVPEPMPLALMGLGMLGIVAFRRKQAK